MTVLTQRDVRGVRAHIRRLAHQQRREEASSLADQRDAIGGLNLTMLEPQTRVWLTHMYVVLTHEIEALRSEHRAAMAARDGAPSLTRTVAGVSLGQVLDILDAIDEHSAVYSLPPGVNWTSRVTRLQDAWIGSLHTERYRLDFWGAPPLVEQVFATVQQQLFP